MKNWRIWAIVLAYGALYGYMGAVLALRNPAGAAMWAMAMILIHAVLAWLLWRWKVVRLG